MLFFALAITLAGLTGLGFPNPDQAWARGLKDDRGTGAPQAAQPAPEALQTPDERTMPALVPERIPMSTHEQVPLPCTAPRGYRSRVALSEGDTLGTVEQPTARRPAGLVWMTIGPPRIGSIHNVVHAW